MYKSLFGLTINCTTLQVTTFYHLQFKAFLNFEIEQITICSHTEIQEGLQNFGLVTEYPNNVLKCCELQLCWRVSLLLLTNPRLKSTDFECLHSQLLKPSNNTPTRLTDQAGYKQRIYKGPGGSNRESGPITHSQYKKNINHKLNRNGFF